MGMRSGTTFKKRQKELARMEKQRDKAARRLQKKAEPGDPSNPNADLMGPNGETVGPNGEFIGEDGEIVMPGVHGAGADGSGSSQGHE